MKKRTDGAGGLLDIFKAAAQDVDELIGGFALEADTTRLDGTGVNGSSGWDGGCCESSGCKSRESKEDSLHCECV